MKKTLQSLIVFIIVLLGPQAMAQVLTVKPFTLQTTDGQKVIEVQKHGVIRAYGQETGRVLKNGQVQNVNGVVLASLDKDGIFKDSNQQILGKILEDGNWDNGNGAIKQLVKDGVCTINETFSLQLQPNDKTLYKTASVLVLLTFYFNTIKDNPEPAILPNPEVVLVLSKSPGSPGTQSYEYTFHADGKISMPGYNHTTAKYRITPEQLATVLAAAKDIDIENLAANAKPLPFVHDGQVQTLKLMHDHSLLQVHFGPGADPMPREVETYIRYVQNFLAKALKNQ